MAIDTVPWLAATNLAHPEKTFYPVSIPVSHWQLRHYISSSEPNRLYYASSQEIFCLETASKKRKHVATLPFEARCMASGYGWVCVAGEDGGHFVAIKPEDHPSRLASTDAWAPTVEADREASTNVKVERIGEDIVNSISIHHVQYKEADLDDFVAVLTNNDKTVRIYSLPMGLETAVLDLPFPINHATISPDGRTLVAVGDDNQAFFFRGEIESMPQRVHKPPNGLTSISIDWRLSSIVELYISSPDVGKGYFTTAWSPSGRLVAVGSEDGYITVFDVEKLHNQDIDDREAIVAVVPGSRPGFVNPYLGAVRSMMFSPGPWDLLIWAEDQGRICIGDLRTGLMSRQVIHLDPKAEDLTKVTYEDATPDYLVSPSLFLPSRETEVSNGRSETQEGQEENAAIESAPELVDVRRRQMRHLQEFETLQAQIDRLERNLAVGDDPQGLTAHEQHVLESLRTTRQREEARARGGRQGGVPRSVNYTNPDMFREPSATRSTSTSNTGDSWARPINDILTSVQDSLSQLSRMNVDGSRPGSSHGVGRTNARPSPSTTENTIENATERVTSNVLVRIADGLRPPRRRASVLFTPPSTNPASSLASSPTHADGSSQSSSGPRATNGAEDNPWAIAEEHANLTRRQISEIPSRSGRSRTGEPQPGESQSGEAESLPTPLAEERRLARSLSRQRERWRNLAMANAARSEATGANTAGPSARTGMTVSEARALLNISPMRLSTLQEYEALRRTHRIRPNHGGHGLVGRTAGLAMSDDGRTLWAACEEGIFEIQMRLKERLFWPSVEPR